jgi:alpha-amylase
MIICYIGIESTDIRASCYKTQNGIHSASELRILIADGDLYAAVIEDKVILKLGPWLDIGNLIPSGFHVVAHGDNYCIWEKSPNM